MEEWQVSRVWKEFFNLLAMNLAVQIFKKELIEIKFPKLLVYFLSDKKVASSEHQHISRYETKHW